MDIPREKTIECAKAQRCETSRQLEAVSHVLKNVLHSRGDWKWEQGIDKLEKGARARP